MRDMLKWEISTILVSEYTRGAATGRSSSCATWDSARTKSTIALLSSNPLQAQHNTQSDNQIKAKFCLWLEFCRNMRSDLAAPEHVCDNGILLGQDSTVWKCKQASRACANLAADSFHLLVILPGWEQISVGQ